jgi:hypothetical protein
VGSSIQRIFGSVSGCVPPKNIRPKWYETLWLAICCRQQQDALQSLTLQAQSCVSFRGLPLADRIRPAARCAAEVAVARHYLCSLKVTYCLAQPLHSVEGIELHEDRQTQQRKIEACKGKMAFSGQVHQS